MLPSQKSCVSPVRNFVEDTFCISVPRSRFLSRREERGWRKPRDKSVIVRCTDVAAKMKAMRLIERHFRPSGVYMYIRNRIHTCDSRLRTRDVRARWHRACIYLRVFLTVRISSRPVPSRIAPLLCMPFLARASRERKQVGRFVYNRVRQSVSRGTETRALRAACGFLPARGRFFLPSLLLIAGPDRRRGDIPRRDPRPPPPVYRESKTRMKMHTAICDRTSIALQREREKGSACIKEIPRYGRSQPRLERNFMHNAKFKLWHIRVIR